MIIGKQSNLNDLQELKTHLETKITAAAAIKAMYASEIGSGNLETGDLYDRRPNGIYHFNNAMTANGQAFLNGMTVEKNGMLLAMEPPFSSTYSVAMAVQWEGEVKFLINKGGSPSAAVSVLTSRNTIKDANGFIKAA